MDIRKVKKLIELLEESGIAEIEISEGEESVRISRYPAGGGQAAPVVHYAQRRRSPHPQPCPLQLLPLPRLPWLPKPITRSLRRWSARSTPLRRRARSRSSTSAAK
jgi:hypothetical protein